MFVVGHGQHTTAKLQQITARPANIVYFSWKAWVVAAKLTTCRREHVAEDKCITLAEVRSCCTGWDSKGLVLAYELLAAEAEDTCMCSGSTSCHGRAVCMARLCLGHSKTNSKVTSLDCQQQRNSTIAAPTLCCLKSCAQHHSQATAIRRLQPCTLVRRVLQDLGAPKQHDGPVPLDVEARVRVYPR